MSCPDGKHDLRAINPFVHPTEKDGDGQPLEVIGAPPQSDEEPAWCRTCGALHCKKPFGLGWGFSHPLTDSEAPTLLNLLREASGAPAHKRVDGLAGLVKMLRETADRLDSGEERGGLTGVVLVAEGAPGVFAEAGPLGGAWTSPQGGKELLTGLREAIEDVETLRKAKGRRVQ